MLVEYAYSFLRLIFITLPNFTAQSSLITAQMGGVYPLF